MARVTVEDCVQRVQNRFELVLLAAQRARDIHSGALLTVERDNDKNAVVALREIADETIDLDALRHELEHGRDLEVEIDEPEEESMAMLSAEQAWADATGGRSTDSAAPKAAEGDKIFTDGAAPEAAKGDEISEEADAPESASDAGDEEPSADKPEET